MVCWKAVSEKERYMFRVRNSGYLDVLKEDMQTVGVTQEDEKDVAQEWNKKNYEPLVGQKLPHWKQEVEGNGKLMPQSFVNKLHP